MMLEAEGDAAAPSPSPALSPPESSCIEDAADCEGEGHMRHKGWPWGGEIGLRENGHTTRATK